MIEKNPTIRQILSIYSRFAEAVSIYVESLEKKEAWKLLEYNLNVGKQNGWPDEKIEKYAQWMRKGFRVFNKQQEKSMAIIKEVAYLLSDAETNKLIEWVATAKCSKEAWENKIITINSSKNVIQARVIHLILLIRTDNKIRIGQLIKDAANNSLKEAN